VIHNGLQALQIPVILCSKYFFDNRLYHYSPGIISFSSQDYST